jgi:hypothetical protein
MPADDGLSKTRLRRITWPPFADLRESLRLVISETPNRAANSNIRCTGLLAQHV